MEPSDHIDPPNPPMDPEQQAVADSLSDEFIQKIDDELLSHAKTLNRKVAMLVMLAMSNLHESRHI